MQGALPPAPPASPRNSRGATPCQAINFDIFRHIERECSQGFKGGDFRRKYYPSLDGTERHTALAEGKATRLSLLPHGECGVWGNAPRVKFRDGVRPPFSKGEEDWGLPPASEYRSRSAGGKAPFSPLQEPRGDWRSDREKRELKSSLFLRFHRGVLRHPPMGALCFVTLFGVVGAKPLPLGEPRVLIRSVKTHTGLLLTKVTKPCIMDSSKRKT